MIKDTENGWRDRPPVLSLEGISLWRDGVTIISDVSLRVQKGQHWAVVGPNGSGKTTLLMIACGYRQSSAGRVFLLDGWHGDIVIPEVRRRVGIVSNSIAEHFLKYHPGTTGIQAVISGRTATLGSHHAERAGMTAEAERLLANMNASHIASMTFHHMSSGQRQVCLIARALMSECELLVFDEPCANLDLTARESMLSLIDHLTTLDGGPTVIFVTHHIEEIVEGITHVLMVRHGKEFFSGHKQEALTDERISRLFNVPVSVTVRAGRYWPLVDR